METHAELIRDQFTRQAIPFATAPSMSDAKVLQLLVDFSRVSGEDTVLDVACGPGLVAAAMAKVARTVTGIDLTPAMIDRARAYCAGQGLANVGFQLGDVMAMPFPDGAFSLVLSRFAFHHLVDPRAVLAEKVRCCKPGGRIMIVDACASDDPEKAAAWNRVEVLRDPSHVAFRTLAYLTEAITSAGLKPLGAVSYPHPVELEALLARSFPKERDADRVRKIFAESVAGDRLGVGLHWVGKELHFSYRAVALLADR